MKNKDYIHKEFPKTCDPKDFFGQIKRTVNGQPISRKEINMIIKAIKNGLQLNQNDILVDIGCGNGALSELLFSNIQSYVGIDFSEFLINVAKENFEKENYIFELGEANAYLENTQINNKVTKGLCYGVFSYFEEEKAMNILKLLKVKYPSLSHFYIGNLPDKDRASNFYYDHIDFTDLLEDNQSSIGIWRNKKELTDLFNTNGWDVAFFNMPKSFYSSHYRFDVVLTRKK